VVVTQCVIVTRIVCSHYVVRRPGVSGAFGQGHAPVCVLALVVTWLEWLYPPWWSQGVVLVVLDPVCTHGALHLCKWFIVLVTVDRAYHVK